MSNGNWFLVGLHAWFWCARCPLPLCDNNTTLSRTNLVAKLQSLGLPVAEQEMWVPTMRRAFARTAEPQTLSFDSSCWGTTGLSSQLFGASRCNCHWRHRQSMGLWFAQCLDESSLGGSWNHRTSQGRYHEESSGLVLTVAPLWQHLNTPQENRPSSLKTHPNILWVD